MNLSMNWSTLRRNLSSQMSLGCDLHLWQRGRLNSEVQPVGVCHNVYDDLAIVLPGQGDHVVDRWLRDDVAEGADDDTVSALGDAS